jgi:flagellar motility protein MotE (MotC chaperone)
MTQNANHAVGSARPAPLSRDTVPTRASFRRFFAPILPLAVCAAGLWPVAAHAAVTLPAPPPNQAETARPPPPSSLTGDDGVLDGRVVEELSRRKATLDRLERDLALREAKLAAAEALARREIAALTRLRGEVERMLSRESAGADQDLALLAALYSNMKPVQAGMILAKLDVPKAAAILRRLDTRLAGPVLASMDPEIAAAITRELERHRAAFRQ